MSELLQRAAERVQDSMDEILANFKLGAKITVLVRTPGKPTADFCMTDDDLDEVVSMVQRRKGEAPPQPHLRGIYIASKTKHADRWRFLRDHVGEPIISTWINEAGAGESSDLADLWRRCILEASKAEVLILYREPEDVLKGGWVELGAALASGVTVFAVGIEEFTIANHTRIRHFPDMKAAIAAARQARAAIAAEGPQQ